MSLPLGIHITTVAPPTTPGWPIITHCPLCRQTVIVLHSWCIKPTDGDFFYMPNTCVDEECGERHNMMIERDMALTGVWTAEEAAR
jgi:hypothetical protein